ncbi:MAG: hypothetical protein JWL86_7046, partial [Rhizobium sp.]|nr:hypothetical protein [Rhizobium sp.]
RAACGLDDDAGARESALSKRAVLEHAEFEDQVAAISG